MRRALRFVVTARRATMIDATARELPKVIAQLQASGATVSVRVAAPPPASPRKPRA